MPLPTLNLDLDLTSLPNLVGRLKRANYLEAPIAELVGKWDISELSGPEYPQYCWRCRQQQTPLSQLVQVFLLALPARRQSLVDILGEKVVNTLYEVGVLVEVDGLCESRAAIYPCLGRYIFTDFWVSEGAQEEGKVYELGTDSYVLARVTPRREVGQALDLCTGSGVHAILSAKDSPYSAAVDINPRALAYTRLNAAVNGVGCPVFLGDLYSQVEDKAFDLITANPPFVPSPDTNVLIHRSAGESGEEVPERLVAGLPKHLREGGLFSMVLEHPVFAEETYLNRLERWLGEKNGWGISVLTFKEIPIGQYARNHLGGVEDQEKTFNAYMESYARQGIQAVRFANVFIQRLGSDSPNWKVNQMTPWPNVDITYFIQFWLDCLLKYHDLEWQPAEAWKPALSEMYADVWRNWNGSRGILELARDAWLEPPVLNSDEADLIFEICPGTKTVGQLKNDWLESGKTEKAFLEAFRGLGLRRAIAPD